MRKSNYLTVLLPLLFIQMVFSQNEYNNWYFGSSIGVYFGATPPSTNNLGQTNTTSGSACISDSSGNLLFYTNGITVYNKNHQVMANGSGIFGSISAIQTALILKKPQSSNIYYIFTVGTLAGQKYNYSIVDMNLAAGMGSVTVKNLPLWYPSTNSSRILTGTSHCNGIDYWVVCHELGNKVFHSYKFTSAGVDTNAVVSVEGSSLCCIQGNMKISPNGKKIALVNKPQTTFGEITINDFDNSTGSVLSNSIVLTGIDKYPQGIEFSPNGNLFYGSSGYGGSATSTVNNTVMQWNLCAGDNQAVNNSMQILSSPISTINSSSAANGMMQIAPDGKIYIGRFSQYWIATIDYPDSVGTACHFNLESLLIYPLQGSFCLPNFINSPLRTSPLNKPTHTVTCQDVSFNASNSILNYCTASGYSLLSTSWNFGEPSSGFNNTSILHNPTHHYNSIGTYTAIFIANYPCTTDSVKIVVNITNAAPSFSVTGKTTICKGETATLTANGAYTYSWSTTATSNSVAVSPTLSTNYTVVAADTLNGCKSKLSHSVTVNKCTGMIEEDPDQHVLVYPNPNDGNFNIESEQIIDIAIYNTLGKLIYNKSQIRGLLNIELSQFDKGIYFIEIKAETFNKKLKMIKSE